MTRRGNGEGSVYQRRDGRWVASLSAGSRDGRRVRKIVYGATRPEAVAKLRELQRRLAIGTLRPGRPITVGAFLAGWLERAAVRVGPTTLIFYAQKLRLHVIPEIGHLKLERLTVTDVENLLAAKARELSPRSASHIRTVLRTAFSDAVVRGILERNPASLAHPVRVEERELAYLDVAQGRAFLAAARRDRLAALYELTTLGLRQGELLGLRWQDVDIEHRVVHIRRSLKRIPGKGLIVGELKTRRSRRDLPLPQFVIDSLRDHRKRQNLERLAAGRRWVDSGLVFTTYQGRPLSATHVVASSFRRICRESGSPAGLRFHDLRHSAATLLLALGLEMRVVMDILGHSTIASTARYQHVPAALLIEAVRRLDDALGGQR